MCNEESPSSAPSAAHACRQKSIVSLDVCIYLFSSKFSKSSFHRSLTGLNLRNFRDLTVAGVKAKMRLNAFNVVRILGEEFPSRSVTPVTSTEHALARHLSGIIREHMRSNVSFELETELVFEDPLCEEMDSEKCCEEMADTCLEELEGASEEFSSGGCSSSSSFHATPEAHPPNRRDDIPFSKRKSAVEFWRSAKGRERRAPSAVKNRFRFVESEKQLERWEEQIKRNGPYHDKMARISSFVRVRFREARNHKKSVHDQDLRRWGLMESRRIGVDFKASSSWLRRLKKVHHITSRKITKFVSKGAAEQTDTIIQAADNFVNDVRADFKTYSPAEIFNTDQSGFNLEMHAGRTLATVGDKHVESVVQSVSATTHSYTIMPTISASGSLMSPLVIVFKEPEGKFGTNVEHCLFKAHNVYPIAARSSMMGKVQISDWFQNAFLPNIGEKGLLLVDSLNSYRCVKELLPKEKNIIIKTMPPHTTGMIQPLDVFFFRQWKAFCRNISEYVLLENVDFQLRKRNNIIKLQSFVHNQFSAPAFNNFRRYAWHKAGYFEDEAARFDNPLDVCFTFEESWCSECDNVALLKCGWCQKPRCFRHSLIELHIHNE